MTSKQHAKETTPLLVDVPEAARLLGVEESFVWRRVHRGEIPSVLLSRKARRIYYADLLKYIASKEVAA